MNIVTTMLAITAITVLMIVALVIDKANDTLTVEFHCNDGHAAKVTMPVDQWAGVTGTAYKVIWKNACGEIDSP